MDLALFLFSEFGFQNKNHQFQDGYFEMVMNQKIWGLGTVTAKIGTNNWI